MMLVATPVAPAHAKRVNLGGKRISAARSTPVRSTVQHVVIASAQFEVQQSAVSRRNALIGAAGATLLSTVLGPLPANADDTYTFYGAANPPATYGGVGGTTRDKARYSIVLPSVFKEDVVSKVDKGTSGIDCKFSTGGRKKETVFVITLRNEGSRDGLGFQLKDADTSLKTVSGSLFALQDAISAGSVASKPAPGGGFTYEITGGPVNYAAWVRTSKDGRLFAIFVGAPDAGWSADKDDLIKIRDSFQVYDVAD